jgi:hypothetical protein
MGAKQSPEWLDQLFVQDVSELERLGNLNPRSDYALLQMSGILRRLVADEQPLAHHARSRCSTPLVVLAPEPISGNPRYDPSRVLPPTVMHYAPEISNRTHPFGLEGYFHCPYTMDEYLGRPHMVLPNVKSDSMTGRAITPREMIQFFANKLGGVHADKNLVDIADGGRSVDAETLHLINKKVSIFGEEALFHQFGVIGERIWRACAPLRDELLGRAKTT